MILEVKELKRWFLKNRRFLPWREEYLGKRDPYRVWISEIMLQQTRVEVVCEYFNRWMNRFPDVDSLAQAPEEEVLRYWAGLGYYSRARNIYKAARVIHELGAFPINPIDVAKLPGVGPYTCGAICSLAYNQAVPLLDGNLIRVFSRFYGNPFEHWSSQGKQELWKLAQNWVEAGEPKIVNEALMELGAVVCKAQNPLCDNCPLLKNCTAYKRQLTDILPLKKPRAQSENLHLIVIVNRRGKKIQLVRQELTRLLKGQWTLPYFEKSQLEEFFPQGIEPHFIALSNSFFKHSIMHYKITVQVFMGNAQNVPGMDEALWLELEEAKQKLTSSLFKKALKFVEEIWS